MDERDIDYSKEHAIARRKMRRFLLNLEVENTDEIIGTYYHTLTLSEHEAARRARQEPSDG